MKLLRTIQKVAIAVGCVYGFWLGCQSEATANENTSAFLIVALVIVIVISLFSEDIRKEELNGKKRA